MLKNCFVVVLALGIGASTAWSQTVRFETNVGDFDMVLNPNNDPNLQPLVDNLIAYVGLGRYSFSAINRAADNNNTDPSDDFVLQMGGFMAFPPTPDLWSQLLLGVDRLPEVIVDQDGDNDVDFDTLSNTRGTVSLALSSIASGPNVNSGTSSFFVNLGDNAFLNDQNFDGAGVDSGGFVPFAQIENMDTIDRILALTQRNLSGGSGNLALTDVPLTDEGKLVVVERARVIEADDNFSFVGPIATALQLQNRGSAAASNGASAASMAALSSSSSSSLPPASLTSTTIPEPGAVALLAPIAVWGALRVRQRNHR